MEFYGLPSDITSIINISDLVASILILVWVFKFRNRFKLIHQDKKIDLSPILTFFFQIFYLQYKINQVHDAKAD